MRSKTATSKWATPEQWEAQRSTITDLYEKNDMPLRLVMEIMRDEYQFSGTIKQYKWRITKWGMRKNARRRDVGGLSDKHRPSIRDSLAPSGVSILSQAQQRSEGHHRSMPLDPGTLSTQYSLALSCRAPSPTATDSFLFSLTTPEALRIPEECMHLSQQYISVAFSSGLWSRAPETNTCVADYDKLLTWYNQVAGPGTELFLQGQMSKAFKMYQDAFNRFSSLLKAPDPRLFIMMYLAGVYLSDIVPEVARAIFRYAADLCRILYKSPQHPLYLYMAMIASMSTSQFRQNARHMGEHLFDQIEAQLDPTSPLLGIVMGLRCPFINFLATKRLLELDVVELMFDQLFQRFHYVPQDMRREKFKLKLQMINMYEEMNEFTKAHRIIAEVLASDDIQKDPSPRQLTYLNLSMLLIARKEDNRDAVLPMVDKMAGLCMVNLKLNDRRTTGMAISILTNLESYLREVGYVDEADKVRGDLDICLRETDDVDGDTTIPVPVIENTSK